MWRTIISKPQCEHQGSFDTSSDTKEKRNEAEKEEIGDEAWLRGKIRKVDNFVTILLDDQGYQVTMTMTMMMMMNGIFTLLDEGVYLVTQSSLLDDDTCH